MIEGRGGSWGAIESAHTTMTAEGDNRVLLQKVLSKGGLRSTLTTD